MIKSNRSFECFKDNRIVVFPLLLMFLFSIVILSLSVINLPNEAFAASVSLPQTGQTMCYNASGTEISCAGTGQDGEIQAGEEWPNPRFTVNGDCVTDNLTGLMWTKNGNLPNGYKTWQEAVAYANNLALCGYSDWRLSNVVELESLVNARQTNSAAWLNTQGFTNVKPNYYWTATTGLGYPDYAWIIDMNYGNVGYSYKADANCYVWPVRGGQ